jgi:hypothetical protein
MAHHVLSPGTSRAHSLTHAQSLQGRTTGTELADLTTDTSPAVDGTHCAGNSNRHHWCAHGPSQCKGKTPHLSSSHACGPRAQFVCKHAMRNHLPCESRSALSLTFFLFVLCSHQRQPLHDECIMLMSRIESANLVAHVVQTRPKSSEGVSDRRADHLLVVALRLT